MLKLAIISTYPPTPCGVAEYTRFLVESMLRYSPVLEVTILADDLSGNHPRSHDRVRVVPCFTPGRVDYEKLVCAARDLGPFDVIHVQHEYGLFPQRSEFLDALEELGSHCKVLVATLHTVRHSMLGEDVVEHQRRLTSICDAVIVHSVLQEYELWSQGVDLRKVYRIPHGTWVQLEERVSKEEALAKLGLRDLASKFVFSSPGFVRWDKGPDVLVRAFAKVHEAQPNAALVLAGVPQGAEGEEVARKLEAVIPASARSAIRIVRRYLSREELSLLLKASDVVVFAYREVSGHIGVSGMFHMAIGAMRPVICVRIPRLVECSLYAPDVMVAMGDEEGLVAKMLEAMEDYRGFTEKCKPLFDLALETSWDRVALKHLELYEQLVGTTLNPLKAS